MRFCSRLLLTLLSTISLTDGATPQTAPSEPTNAMDVENQIATVLQIPDVRVDFLTPFKAAMHDFLADQSKADASIDRLVQVLNSGHPANDLATVLIPTTSIEGSFIAMRQPGWPYGTFMDRVRFTSYLFTYAQATENLDPAKSRDYARADFLLISQETFYLPFTELHSHLKKPGFARLAQLTDEKAALLNQIVTNFDRKQAPFNRQLFDGCFPSIDAIKKDSPGPVPSQQVDEIIKQLRVLSNFIAAEPGDQYEAAEVAWSALNILRARQDDDNVNKMQQFITGWRDASPQPLKRWLTEALEKVGNPG